MANARHLFVAVTIVGLSLIGAAAAHAQTVLVTGANSGIGLEFTKQYLARGWTVIATHRRSELPATLAELTKKYRRFASSVDVTSVEQVRALASRLANVPIDVLVNNAGVYNDRGVCAPEDDACAGDWTTQNFGKMRYELLDTILSVNVKGPLLVSEMLFPNVKASTLKKIVAISSSNGSLTGRRRAEAPIFYRSSKAALNPGDAARRRIGERRRRHRGDVQPRADAHRAPDVSEGPVQGDARDVLHRWQHDQDHRHGDDCRQWQVSPLRWSSRGMVMRTHLAALAMGVTIAMGAGLPVAAQSGLPAAGHH